jgi:hypothetical protein
MIRHAGRPKMIVTVTATVMDGTVVRWYDDRNIEGIGRPWVSVSRNGVLVDGYLHEVPEVVLALAQEIHRGWQRDRDAWPDIRKLATHRRRGILGPLEPVEREVWQP